MVKTSSQTALAGKEIVMNRPLTTLVAAILVGIGFMLGVVGMDWAGQRWISEFINQFPRDSRFLTEAGMLTAVLFIAYIAFYRLRR